MNHTAQRFFRKRLLSYLGIILIPLFLFSVLSIWKTHTNARRDAEAMSMTVLGLLEESTGYILDELDSFVLAVQHQSLFTQASDILIKPTLSYERRVALSLITEWMKSIVDSRPYIASIYIYFENDNGRTLTSAQGLSYLDTMEDTAWLSLFRARKGQESRWSQRRPYISYAFERDQPPETVSIFHTIQKERGVVVLNLSPDYLLQQLTEVSLYDEQRILVLNAEYEPLFHNADARWLDDPLLLSALREQEGGQQLHIEGHSLFVLPQNQYGWRFVSLTPDRVLYRLPNSLFLFSLVLILPCLALAVVMALLSSRREYRRLRAIYGIIDEAEAGMIPAPLPTREEDEYSYIEQNLLTSFVAQNRMQRQLQEKNYLMKSMELLALQAQINPHFLVNTLSTIFWKSLGLTEGPNVVSGMIEDLQQLLELLGGNPNEQIPVERELEYLQCYVNIQQRRFPNRFVYVQEIDPACAGLRILKLILQPLVENCITHALLPDQMIQITVSVTLRQEVELTVRDDGAGMDAAALQALKEAIHEGERYQHIGLFNTVKRVMLYYDLPDPVEIRSEPGSGTEVCLRLPAAYCLEAQNRPPVD